MVAIKERTEYELRDSLFYSLQPELKDLCHYHWIQFGPLSDSAVLGQCQTEKCKKNKRVCCLNYKD